ncbi:hypothetical protein [Ruegeria arenilitoris]|uniref:hypothetical protein n=1 Tax=Ruegeria arenilitoris TaxID=1173585 RepID=UPI001C2BBDAD|nr:hypothetical protein [Ruegeria arenilitoris]
MMQAISFKFKDDVHYPHATQLQERTVQIINHLRMVALQCRSASRVDLDQACALLLADPADAHMRHAEILMRGLRQALSKRPVFFRPGTTELSFDEAWLGRLIEAVERKDDDSFRFLIRSRVPRWTQQNLAFLVRSVSEQFRQI